MTNTQLPGTKQMSKPPPLLAWRQSVVTDLQDIEEMQSLTTKPMFGEVDIRNCIEKCLCKTLVNVEDEVVGFLVLMDYPNIPILAHCTWINWIRRFYRIDFASPWNTLFIHYLVWDSRYPTFLSSILKSLYKNNAKLQQILMITPPKTQIPQDLESMFTPVYPRGEGISGSGGAFSPVQTIHINLRHRVLSKLIVRRAAEEDNIDVQPLVHHQFEVLKYVYGDFKLGNIIDLKTPSKSVLVAEKTDSVTVGVLSLSSDVDYEQINSYFYDFLQIPPGRRSTYSHSRTISLRSEIRRGAPITPENFSADEQLSDDMYLERGLTTDEESCEEEEDREELYFYWDMDGDTFRVVDPVMGYLLQARQRGAHGSELEDRDSVRKGSNSSRQSVDYTYWGRPSLNGNLLEESLLLRERGGTQSIKENQHNYSFYSTENAFIITLFALHPDLDVRYAFDMLEASFECFPDKQFCLLALPTIYQGSPLTKHMVKMVPKMSWDFPHELYVTHRNSTFSEFTVRFASITDLSGIQELIENISTGKRICKALTDTLLDRSSNTKAFVLECEENIVGIALVTINFGLHQLQPHYKIDELIQLRLYDNDVHGLIRHLVLCPIFLKSGPFFLTQIMHLAGLETLSYCLLNEEIIRMLKLDISPITVLENMVPVRPRNVINYDSNVLDIYTPENYVVWQEHDFALFVTTRKILSIPKLELNYRIIVVGCSDTATSFLEHLIFKSAQKHIRYSNIVLVSVQGFPQELRSHATGDKMVPHSGVYTKEYCSKINLPAHVNLLYGALTVINRKEKMICLNEDHWVRYDYLFLLTGMQFCKPWPEVDLPGIKHSSSESSRGQTIINAIYDSNSSLKDDRDYPKQDCRKNVDIRDLYNLAAQDYGDNLFVINTTTDAIKALGQLKKIIKLKKEGKVLIYGNSLNTYTCVESLLVFGVPGHKIMLVLMPHAEPSHYCLANNPYINKTIDQTMIENGVTIHSGYSLIRWSLKNRSLQKVMFRNDNNIPLTIDCIALFCYGTKSTSAKTYMAVNDSGIVYNNGIIIDNHFRTNDEYIYAAGPGTRYSNRYKANQLEHHKYFNSIEIGKRMSRIFRYLVEPRVEDHKPPNQTSKVASQISGESEHFQHETPASTPSKDTLIELRDPIIQVANLPGGWNYVKISAPGRPLPLECQLNGQGDSGPVLITGVPILPDGPGYFQLSFSVYNTVREIVLLSKNEIPYKNLQYLYSKHERLLNNLYDQYNQSLISDFFAYFRQPWAYAMYTSRFNELVRKCATIFVSSDSIGLPNFQGLQNQTLDTILRHLRADREEFNNRYLTSSAPVYVEYLTLKYISERGLQLPMYYTDALLAAKYQLTYNTSPLHRDPARSRQKTKTSMRDS